MGPYKEVVNCPLFCGGDIPAEIYGCDDLKDWILYHRTQDTWVQI